MAVSQAVILVGGEGTRLRPLTDNTPKPVLPLAGRPFIRYMIDWLSFHGVEEAVLACGFRPDKVRDALGDQADGGPRLRYVEEPEPRGTAGAIKFAEEMLEDRFLALNGDVLTNLDLSALITAHEERDDARATIALHPIEDPSEYGLVRRTADGEILGFVEKPGAEEIDTDEVNAGAYVLERSILDQVPPDREVSIEREVFPTLVGKGLYGVRLEGYWLDIGTPERYHEAEADILAGRYSVGARESAK
jgi:mannose-1-phosphate guanylyltransferase